MKNAQNVKRDFKILTSPIRAVKEVGEDGSERYFLEGTASSTVVDRHGDIIDANAQAEMLAAARELTMWLNHSYVVPEDILGTCKESSLQNRVDAEQGDCIDLDIRLEVYAANDRAFKAWKAVNDGIRLGFSIGGGILDFDWVDEEDWMNWSIVIHSIDLYEISLVGIPANPRAYTKFVEDIAKGIRQRAKSVDPALVLKAKDDPAARAALKQALLEKENAMDPELRSAAGATDEEVIAEALAQADAAGDTPAGETTPSETPAEALNGVSVPADGVIRETTLGASGAPLAPPAERTIDVTLAFKDLALEMQRSILESVIKHFGAEGLTVVKTADAAGAESLTLDLNVRVDEATKTLEQLDQQIVERRLELESLTASIAEQTLERTTLEETIAKLKATPTGRRTLAYPGGSSGSEASRADRLRLSQTTLVNELGKRMAGVSDDPRTRSAQ